MEREKEGERLCINMYKTTAINILATPRQD